MDKSKEDNVENVCIFREICVTEHESGFSPRKKDFSIDFGFSSPRSLKSVEFRPRAKWKK